MRSIKPGILLAALAFGLSAGPGEAQQPDAKDKAEIGKRQDAFVEAFHKGDAKAVAAFWAEDGDYTDVTGKHHKGRAAIEKAFAGLFAENKGLKVRVDSDSLRFVTPDVALEEGTTSVIPADGGPPSRAKYAIVHVKKDGKWLLNTVRDAIYTPPSNYEHLRDLEWLVGNWADANSKGAVARVDYAWAKDQNYLLSTFATTFKNIYVGGGTQWIGYDPATKQVRSWTFELNGGFGEGAWSRDGKAWTVKTTATDRDGAKVTLTTVITPVDADTLTWQVKDLTVGGKAQPAVPAITMKRVK